MKKLSVIFTVFPFVFFSFFGKPLSADNISFRYLSDDKSHLEAVFSLDYPADLVWKVLTDYEASPRFLPNTEKVTILKNEDMNKVTETVIKSGPFTISYLCGIIEDSSSYTMNWQQNEGPFKVFFGSWKLVPEDDSKTRVIYTVKMIHPLMPASVKNSLIKGSIPKIRKRLSAYLARQ